MTAAVDERKLNYVEFDELPVDEMAEYVIGLLEGRCNDAKFVLQLDHILACTKRMCNAVIAEKLANSETPENTGP